MSSAASPANRRRQAPRRPERRRPGAAPAAFRAAQDLEAAPFLGDTWFYRALAALGAGRSRLIETCDGQALPAAPPVGDGHALTAVTLRLTPTGERVLQGNADRVELLGIDRWVGGTHITAGTAWRWDPAAGQLSQPAPAIRQTANRK